jgi:AcrR family transcriptional regulator
LSLSTHYVSIFRILDLVPKLWVETIEAHRRTVRDAILDTTAALVAKHGLAAVTMSQIAEEAGVGRATLYKYFSDVDTILVAWHDRLVTRHLEYLVEVRDRSGDVREQLEAVLEAYAVISYEREREHHGGQKRSREHHTAERRSHEHPTSDIGAVVHRTEHVAGAQRRLHDFIRDLLARAARASDVRDDVPPDELARYCLHSLAAANGLQSKSAVRRLVTVTLAGLRPPRR